MLPGEEAFQTERQQGHEELKMSGRPMCSGTVSENRRPQRDGAG